MAPKNGPQSNNFSQISKHRLLKKPLSYKPKVGPKSVFPFPLCVHDNIKSAVSNAEVKKNKRKQKRLFRLQT